MSVRPRPSAPYTHVIGAELCSGSTKDFESFCPGSNPGSAAKKNILGSYPTAAVCNIMFGTLPDSSMVERAAVNR